MMITLLRENWLKLTIAPFPLVEHKTPKQQIKKMIVGDTIFIDKSKIKYN